jgi:hypothetical protein
VESRLVVNVEPSVDIVCDWELDVVGRNNGEDMLEFEARLLVGVNVATAIP